MKGICKSCARERELVQCFDCFMGSMTEKVHMIQEGSKLTNLELEVTLLRHKIDDMISIIKNRGILDKNVIKTIEQLRDEEKTPREDVFK